MEVEVEVEGDVKEHENDIGTYVRLCRSNECMDSFFFIHLDWFLREWASLANNTFRNAFDWEKDCIKFSLFLFSIPEHSFTHQRNQGRSAVECIRF